MCGIIGYVGPREAKPLRLNGLERLEYRGYDSAGIALREAGGLDYVRAVGNLQNLKLAAGPNGSVATHGLGHTRWATHGAVTEANAHPLAGCDADTLSIVLNGIVENYRELRASLEADGHTFTSETDAETVTHLIERHYEGDLTEAVRRAFGELEGHFTFVAIHHDHPDLLVGARHQTPLVVGIGEGEMFLASNAAAFLRETRLVQFPDDGDIVTLTPEGATFMRPDGSPAAHDPIELDWDDEGEEVTRLGEGVFPFRPVASASRLAGGDPVAVRQQDREGGGVGFHPHAIFGQHVGPVGEEGDPPEAFGLALGAEHPAGGVEPHKLGVRGRVDLDLGLDCRAVGGDVDHQLRPFHSPAAVAAIDAHRQRHQAVAVELQRALVVAVTLNLDRRAHPGPVKVELKVEPDLRGQPVRRAIIFAADGDVGRGRRRFRNGFGIGKGRVDVGHKRAALGAAG